jgi:acyl phosphate:glycerol-3-phosphate acyltransferase
MLIAGLVFTLILAYLLGSIPFGVVLTRAAGLGDIRQIGSGNIGATNVLRTGNRGLAVATLLGDLLKGTLAVLIGHWLAGQAGALLAAVTAFLAHLYPVWLNFKGGKGVATFLGVLAGTFWPAALGFAAIWLLMAWLTRYSSLAALTASLTTPIVLLAGGQVWAALLFLGLAVLIVWKHAGNIDRLLAGTESRIGSRSASPANESQA